MESKLREHLPRLGLTLLLASGLLMPVLAALDLNVSLLSCLFLCAFLSLCLELLFLSRRLVRWGSVALISFFLFWLLSSGYASLRDVLLAFSLHLSGVRGALPLVADSAARMLTLLLTLLAFFSTRKSAGCLGAVLLTVGSLLMLWLSDRPDLVLPLLPAGVAAFSLYLLDRHEEVSPLRVLPWAGALMLLSFLLTPSSGLVNSDLKKKADELRQTVMDRLFFTEPRDVFSLSAEGFYPQGISQLGGPVSPSDHPVMQVSAQKTVYLRGVMLDAYDGRSWRNTLGGRRYLWDASGMAAKRNLLFNQDLPAAGLSSSLTEAKNVSVRMLSSSASTLFTPQRIRNLRAGGDLVPYFSNSSELFITRNLQEGDTWSVSAPLFQAGDPGLSILIDAASSGEDPQYEEIKETYTSLPSHLEEPVWQLAADITQNLDSSYEKAFALQTWLSRNYRYALDVAIQPADVDFVTNFLFNTREGYCTYFASAMTVLCRMVGLPARYVEGYLAVPNAQGESLVTGLDAHAWTEVYFQNFGWLTFDATPRRSGSNAADSGSSSNQNPDSTSPPEPTPTPDEAPVSGSVTPTLEPASDPEPSDSPAASPAPDPVSSDNSSENDTLPVSEGFPWILLLLLLPAVFLFRWLWTSPSRKEKRLHTEEDRFDLWLNEVFSRLSALRYVRASGETPMSFTRRLDHENLLPVSLSALGECTSLLHYGRVSAQPTDTALARDVALALKKAMPFSARIKYALHRLLPGRSVSNQF